MKMLNFFKKKQLVEDNVENELVEYYHLCEKQSVI